MPDDVWLDRFSVSDSASGNLEGASYTDGGVFDFVNHLEQIPDLKRVALEGTGAKQSPEGPTTSFDLQFALAGTQRSNDRND